MMNRVFSFSLLFSSALLVPALSAQDAPLRSAPSAQPIVDTIPPARDIPYPGTITLAVDASDTIQRIWKVNEVIPVSSSGPLTLLFPNWLPGKHAPRGLLDKLAGLRISAGGKDIGWTRDPVDVTAFHVNVPAGAREIVAEFQFLNPTAPNQGQIGRAHV